MSESQGGLRSRVQLRAKVSRGERRAKNTLRGIRTGALSRAFDLREIVRDTSRLTTEIYRTLEGCSIRNGGNIDGNVLSPCSVELFPSSSDLLHLRAGEEEARPRRMLSLVSYKFDGEEFSVTFSPPASYQRDPLNTLNVFPPVRASGGTRKATR